MDSLLWGNAPNPEDGKEIPQALKNDEEIARFTVDERINDIDRALLYLNGGHTVQQNYAIVNLPLVIKARGRLGFEQIAAPLQHTLSKLGLDAQIGAAESLTTVIKERLLSPADLQACFLPLTLRHLAIETYEEGIEAWLETLSELVAVMDRETLRVEVLNFAMTKSNSEHSRVARILSCRVFGLLAQHMSSDEIQRYILPKALAMCQDIDFMVRISMCTQLPFLARGVGRDMASKALLVELVELVNDEEMKVRVAAITALVNVLDTLRPEARKGKVMDIIRRHMQPLEMDLMMTRCIAGLLGQIAMSLKAELSNEDLLLVSGCFRHLTARGDGEMRQLCAAQLVPLAQWAVFRGGAQMYASQLHDALCMAAADTDEAVRRTLAAHLHEIASKLSGEHCVEYLTRPLLRLLRDPSHAVLGALLPNLHAVLRHWRASEGEARQARTMQELATAIVGMEAEFRSNWRLRRYLAQAFVFFHEYFSSDTIHDSFLPITYRYLMTAEHCVKPAAADALISFIRHNKREKQRGELLLRLINEFAHARSCMHRMTFIELMSAMMRQFSSSFVREYMMEAALELVHDPVPNIRIAICTLLPTMKQGVKLPEDVEILEKLNNAMSSLTTDMDADVCSCGRSINEIFKKTPIKMAGVTGVVDNNGIAIGNPVFEEEDKKKLEAESDFTLTSEDSERIKTALRRRTLKDCILEQLDLKAPLGAGRGARRGSLGDIGVRSGAAAAGSRPSATHAAAHSDPRKTYDDSNLPGSRGSTGKGGLAGARAGDAARLSHRSGSLGVPERVVGSGRASQPRTTTVSTTASSTTRASSAKPPVVATSSAAASTSTFAAAAAAAAASVAGSPSSIRLPTIHNPKTNSATSNATPVSNRSVLVSKATTNRSAPTTPPKPPPLRKVLSGK